MQQLMKSEAAPEVEVAEVGIQEYPEMTDASTETMIEERYSSGG